MNPLAHIIQQVIASRRRMSYMLINECNRINQLHPLDEQPETERQEQTEQPPEIEHDKQTLAIIDANKEAKP